MTSYFDCRPFDLDKAYNQVFTDVGDEQSREAMLHMPPVQLVRATSKSAGLDIKFQSNQPGYILFPSLGFPRHTKLPTGIYWKPDLPEGVCARIQLRSSAWSDGCFALHHGLIDEDYKGEIKLGLSLLCTNNQHIIFPKVINGVTPAFVAHVMPEKPFAQIILEYKPPLLFRDEQVSNRERGDGGFGSTNWPQEKHENDENSLPIKKRQKDSA